MGLGTFINRPFQPLSVTRVPAQSTQSKGLNDAENTLPKKGVEQMERTVSAFRPLLHEIEILRFHLVARQVALDKLQAEGRRLNASNQSQAELAGNLEMVTERERWLRHIKGMPEWHLALGRALHNGEFGTLHVCLEWKRLDKDAVVACCLEYIATMPALKRLLDDLRPITTSPDEASVRVLDALDDDWEIV